MATATATETTKAQQVVGQVFEPVKNAKQESRVAENSNSFFEEVHFLGDKAGKVIIRSPPKFDNPEDQRTYQKQHLAAAFRVFARQGFDEGVAGHICESTSASLLHHLDSNNTN
jgi:hypothetical protein